MTWLDKIVCKFGLRLILDITEHYSICDVYHNTDYHTVLTASPGFYFEKENACWAVMAGGNETGLAEVTVG